MPVTRPLVIATAVAIAAFQIITQLSYAAAGEPAEDRPRSFVVAQAPMGSHDSHAPTLAPVAPPPKADYIPPSLDPRQSAPDEPAPSSCSATTRS